MLHQDNKSTITAAIIWLKISCKSCRAFKLRKWHAPAWSRAPQMKALSCTVRYCGIYSILYLDTQFVVNCGDTASIHCYRMHSHFLHAKYFTKLHFLLQKAIFKVVLYTYYEYSSRNRKHFPCFHAVIHCRNTSGSLGKGEIEVGTQASKASVSTLFQVLPQDTKEL